MQKGTDYPEFYQDRSLSTVTKGYLLPGETPKAMYLRLAKAAAKSLEMPQLEESFFEIMWKGWLGPASPVMSNLGTDRGLPISCYSLHIPDSVDGIYKSIHEMAMLTKHGGGVGLYAGAIRERGATIKGNGQSEGTVPWLKVFDSAILATSQGSTRRGAAAAYIDIEHGDIEEFLRIRRPEGDINRQCMNLHHAVSIPDSFMKAIKKGDKKKRKVWEQLLANRLETGEPYILFRDNVNKANPAAYKKNKLEVETSNICCLTGETKVLTKNGLKEIKDLVGQSVVVFDGIRWQRVESFRVAGVTSELLRFTLSDGQIINCTTNHRWFNDKEEEILAEKLEIGTYLETYDDSTIQVVARKRLFVEPTEVFCPVIPSTGKFALANGLMTGNSEITLYTDDDHTFVCCLSSLNLEKYNEWKDWTTKDGYSVPFLATLFLDGVLQEFIEKAKDKPGFERSVRSAVKGRALGLGVMGWHSYLQKNRLAFGSFGAKIQNRAIFSFINKEAKTASIHLAKIKGEPEWCQGTGMRNSHLIALAPTVTNATICGGVSPSIEPWAANAFNQKTAKGTFIVKNTELESLLKEKGQSNKQTWDSIVANNGSVLHLDFLSDEEKEIFLTAREIDQMDLITQAADRYPYIDQAQSLNLFFELPQDDTQKMDFVKYFHNVHIKAWELGIKSLYYVRSNSILTKASDSSVLKRIRQKIQENCSACEG